MSGPLVAFAGAADHDQPVAVFELGMLDAAAVALDLEADVEAEGVDEPVDGASGILVVEA